LGAISLYFPPSPKFKPEEVILSQQSPTEKSPPGNRGNLPKQILAFIFAIVLLWLAFRGADFEKLWLYSKSIKLWPVCLMAISGVASHFLRAYRWTFLLNPLKDTGAKVSLFYSFYAVMLGYAVNVAIPRGGEVARLVSICKDEKLPWAGVLPTMLIDRMLDLALLVFLLGATLMVLPPEILTSMPWLVPGGGSLLVGTVTGLAILPNAGGIIKKILDLDLIKTKLPGHLAEKLSDLAAQFDTGTTALKSPVTYPVIALLSVAIWFAYWLNFYLFIFAFGLEKLVNPLKCLIAFTIGSVGVLIPTPGSVGSFHFLVKQGLMLTAHIPEDQALAYATVLHFAAFVLVTCLPALALFLYRRINGR
jgi:uncharacterized protein (TIRG00374 family)